MGQAPRVMGPIPKILKAKFGRPPGPDPVVVTSQIVPQKACTLDSGVFTLWVKDLSKVGALLLEVLQARKVGQEQSHVTPCRFLPACCFSRQHRPVSNRGVQHPWLSSNDIKNISQGSENDR